MSLATSVASWLGDCTSALKVVLCVPADGCSTTPTVSTLTASGYVGHLFVCLFVYLFVCLFYCFIASRSSGNKVHTYTHTPTDTHRHTCGPLCCPTHSFLFVQPLRRSNRRGVTPDVRSAGCHARVRCERGRGPPAPWGLLGGCTKLAGGRRARPHPTYIATVR